MATRARIKLRRKPSNAKKATRLRQRLAAMVETAEILSNATAMKAIRDYEAGSCKGKDISRLGD
jgi:hypothetical protein